MHKKKMIGMLLITGLVFGAIFGIKACSRMQANRGFDGMSMPPVTITAAEARLESWAETIEAVGTLVAVNGVDVTTEVEGVVSAIEFESGQTVKAGDLLLRLNTATERATLGALEAGLRLALVQRDRFRELYEGKRLVAKANLDERESQAEQLQAEVDAQRALVAKKTIRAPFAGRLGIRKVNLGQYLAPGDPIVSLQSLDPIHLDFSLPEQRLDRVQVGQRLTATVDALPDRTFTGTITAIEPRVEASTRNFMLQATLGNPDQSLRPGTFARVRAELGAGIESVVVPQTAISFNPYGNSVYVLSPDASDSGQADAPAPRLTVKQRFVRTGATRGDLIAITEGLKPGERVATSGLLKLRNDAVVEINDEVQPTADPDPTPPNS